PASLQPRSRGAEEPLQLRRGDRGDPARPVDRRRQRSQLLGHEDRTVPRVDVGLGAAPGGWGLSTEDTEDTERTEKRFLKDAFSSLCPLCPLRSLCSIPSLAVERF